MDATVLICWDFFLERVEILVSGNLKVYVKLTFQTSKWLLLPVHLARSSSSTEDWMSVLVWRFAAIFCA